MRFGKVELANNSSATSVSLRILQVEIYVLVFPNAVTISQLALWLWVDRDFKAKLQQNSVLRERFQCHQLCGLIGESHINSIGSNQIRSA